MYSFDQTDTFPNTFHFSGTLLPSCVNRRYSLMWQDACHIWKYYIIKMPVIFTYNVKHLVSFTKMIILLFPLLSSKTIILIMILMNVDIFRWGFMAITWYIVHLKMTCLQHQTNVKFLSFSTCHFICLPILIIPYFISSAYSISHNLILLSYYYCFSGNHSCVTSSYCLHLGYSTGKGYHKWGEIIGLILIRQTYMYTPSFCL